jgi:hypothetical protein
VCDFQKQKYFDFDNGTIYMNQNFCFTLINQNLAYLKWKNIYFVKYLYNILQYLNCHSSDGDALVFPFKTQLDKKLYRIYFFEKCFENLNGEDFLKYCHFICSQYRFEVMTELLEGDLKELKQIYIKFIAFLRQNHVEIPYKVDIESIEKAIYGFKFPQKHFDEGIQKDLETMVEKVTK